MFHIALYQPEIPPNTGNIIRLCANTGTCLHLIKPLGFPLDSAKMRRAGLDYHELSSMQVHESWEDFQAAMPNQRLFALTTKAQTRYDSMAYQADDVFVFGPETRGLPPSVLNGLPEQQKIRIPMLPESRSMNLSNTVAVMLFEAWRQQGFPQGI